MVGGGGHDLGLTGSLWPQIKELLKKVEQLSEEVLAVRGENARLASQLRVCLSLGKWSRPERRVDRGSDVGEFWESQRPVQAVVQAGLVSGRGRPSGPADHLILLFLMLGDQGEYGRVGT